MPKEAPTGSASHSCLTRVVFSRPRRSLTHLSLRCNQIGDEGARLIGLALSNTSSANKNLLSLNLAFNSIGDAGAAFLARVRLVFVGVIQPRRREFTLCSSPGTAAESYSGFPLVAQQSDRRLRSHALGRGVHSRTSSYSALPKES